MPALGLLGGELVEHGVEVGVGYALAPGDGADAVGEHEFDFAGADLFIELHGLEEPAALRGAEADGDGKAGTREEAPDAIDRGGGETAEFGGEHGSGDLADGDGFSVEVVAVRGDGFDGVAEGVAEVQNRAQAGFRFVLGDDLGLDFATAGDDRSEDFRVPGEQSIQVAFEAAEERFVVDDAIFDDFGQAGAVLAVGEGLQCSEVAKDQARLVEGADQVLAAGEVDPDLTADRAVDLGEQGGGDLDESEAAEVGGGDEPGEVAGDASAQGDEEGLPFEAVSGELVVALGNDAEGLRFLARRHGDERGVEAGVPQGFEGGLRVERGYVVIRDHRAAGAQAQRTTSTAE